MKFRFLIASIVVFSAFEANAQIGLSPSNEEDDDGTLTPEFMNFLTDSGRLEQNNRTGFWKEYQFAAFLSNRRRAVRYDSLMHYDSTRRYLRFYKLEGENVNGKKEGEWKTFVCFKKRIPLKWTFESKVNYSEGKRQGWEEVFSKTGAFIGKNFYRDDLADSTSFFYYSEDVFSSTTQYKKGKLHGKSIIYKPNGEIQFEITYKDGKRIGSIIYPGDGNEPHIVGQHDLYYDNGKIKSSSNYLHGKLDGAHKTFYLNGNPEKEMNFKEGALDGPFKIYYDNGQLKHEWIYKNGKLWEVVQFFSQKGKSLSPGTLKEGTGSVLTYNDNGKLLTTVNYKNGIQERADADD
jgi:antitoxin component YwqK of YwqJK toxin-antitoxin module